MNKSIKIILPEGITPEDLKKILNKAHKIEISDQVSFIDPVITEIAQNLLNTQEKMFEEIISEVESLLDAEYADF